MKNLTELKKQQEKLDNAVNGVFEMLQYRCEYETMIETAAEAQAQILSLIELLHKNNMQCDFWVDKVAEFVNDAIAAIKALKPFAELAEEK